MNKLSLHRAPLALTLSLALSAFSGQALADQYHVVVPAQGKLAPYAGITVSLRPATLSEAMKDEPYSGFDFNTLLTITGDENLDHSLAAWSLYSSKLPSGMLLTREGHLAGIPQEAGNARVQVQVKYKTKSAVGTYDLQVGDIELSLSRSLPIA